MTRWLPGFCVLLATCGGVTPPVARRAPEVRRCPHATDVRFAFRTTPDDGIVGSPPSEGWAIPVGFEPATDATPTPGPLAPEVVAARGMPLLPSSLHLLHEDGARCVAEVEGYYGQWIEDGVPNLRVVAFSRSCADGHPTAWVSARPFDGCALAPARTVARRALRQDPRTLLDVPPRDRRTLPSRHADALPTRVCTAPCTTLFDVRETRSVPALAEVWVTYLEPTAAVEPCSWPYEDEVALITRGGGRSQRVPHPNLTLYGVLTEGGRARVALFVDHAAWGAFEVTDDGLLGEGAAVQTFIPNEEDGTFRSLAPYCGP